MIESKSTNEKKIGQLSEFQSIGKLSIEMMNLEARLKFRALQSQYLPTTIPNYCQRIEVYIKHTKKTI